MTDMLGLLEPSLLLIAAAVAVVAGIVKGIVGFAMPMILISGLSGFISPEIALAALIFPTVVTNVFQSLRNGPRQAWQTIRQFKLFLAVGGVCLLATAQMVQWVNAQIMLAALGVMVSGFAAMQLAGWQPQLKASPKVEASVGAVAGAIGGFSGVWGPPTVVFLTALKTAKTDQMRIQGVIYGLGSLALLGGHIASGVLTRETAPLSAALVLPALIGMAIGSRVSDRIDQKAFRRATLAVLLIAGLNLLRKGLLS